MIYGLLFLVFNGNSEKRLGGVMKNIFVRAVCFLLSLPFLLLALVSCAEEEPTPKAVDFDLMSVEELSEYVVPGEYKGLYVEVGSADKKDAVWAAVGERCTVKAYPKEQVDYYAYQIKKEYEHVARQKGIKYEKYLSEVGVTEESIIKEAEDMVFDDLVYYAVQKTEGIVLTEKDKENYFDRYAEHYGYKSEEITDEIRKEIYGVMLYEKTTEFLILNNNLS